MCLFFMTIMKRVVICKTTLRSLKQGFVFEPMNEKKKIGWHEKSYYRWPAKFTGKAGEYFAFTLLSD